MSQIKQTLFSVLAQTTGSTFLRITTRTDARCKKPYKHVKKLSKVLVQVTFDYEAGVQRRQEKEGQEATFEAASSWHKPFLVDGKFTPFCVHKDTNELYLRCQHIKTLEEPQYVDDEGNTYSKEEVAEFLPKPSNYARQGLENPLKFLTYAVESILEVAVNGEEVILA